jgi:xylulokinase
MEYVIGCDVGSQAVKAVLLSLEGRIIAEAGSEYTISYPRPAWAEQPAESWAIAVVKAASRLVQSNDLQREQVRAIGLCAQVDGFVPVDKNGNPLHPAIIWMDRRAVSQVEVFERSCDPERIFRITGLNLDPYHVAPKIRWFAENLPAQFEKSSYFLLPGSYIAYYLTGELGVDYSNASSTLLMDVTERCWSPELCQSFQIPLERLAPIFPSTRIIGSLRSIIADEMGLKPHIPVILGCGDEHAASLGAGAVVPGIVCDIGGTAEPVCVASSSPVFDETRLVETHCHADPALWLLENPGFVSGGNYRWFRDQFAHQEVAVARESADNPYDLLNQQAEVIPPGSDGLLMLPTLMGAVTPTWNALARGTFFGFTLNHTRGHFIRAILEASAYALRDITDRMNQLGLGLKEIRAVGGGARSELWRQIKADVTGLPVALPRTVETTALGAGILALVGSGLVASLEDAVQASVEIVHTIEPNQDNVRRYEDYYQLYRELYFSLLPVFEKASKINEGGH